MNDDKKTDEPMTKVSKDLLREICTQVQLLSSNWVEDLGNIPEGSQLEWYIDQAMKEADRIKRLIS